jgi:hypothetical protein
MSYLLLAMVICSMDLGDEFNDYIVNELIDSSSSDDEDNFYFDAANIVSEASLNEPIRRGSMVGRCSIGILYCYRFYWFGHIRFLISTISMVIEPGCHEVAEISP